MKTNKNIHLIGTDKPSRLFISELYQPQNIYITNDEEIKEGDWFFNGEHILQASRITDIIIDTEGQWSKIKNSKKIILTTDSDLIADGVQPIDDEFLEWFVKNPSCEEVEVQKWASLAECGYSYHITIPQEETKLKHKK